MRDPAESLALRVRLRHPPRRPGAEEGRARGDEQGAGEEEHE